MSQDPFDAFDDLRVVSGDTSRPHAFTLTGIVHNEMHFLPVFLPYYRQLGVDRFVFIDDGSDDGTTAYLAAQSDVVVLHSQHRFGERVAFDPCGGAFPARMRMMLIWRTLLLRKFGMDRWSMHVDADEFLSLPADLTLPDLCETLESEGARSVWAVMLDMYPAKITELREMAADDTLDLGRDWYFDGRAHLRLRQGQRPKTIYAGVRARLMRAHDLHPKATWFDRQIGRKLAFPPPRYNAIRKPILLRWKEGDHFLSAHGVTAPASDNVLLPLQHYKFNGAIAQRIDWATKSGSYSGGSAEYFSLQHLLQKMQAEDASFANSGSRLFEGFEDFVQTGNAVGLN